MAFGYGKKIYDSFLKIEQSIEVGRQDKSFNESQIKAFREFEHKKNDQKDNKKFTSNILFLPKDDDKDVHAEAQILNQIVEMIENGKMPAQKEIYIGISKKCCKNCYVLLNAAQEELQKLGIKIKFGGVHGQSFDGNWGRPPFFKKLIELSGNKRTRASGVTCLFRTPNLIN